MSEQNNVFVKNRTWPIDSVEFYASLRHSSVMFALNGRLWVQKETKYYILQDSNENSRVCCPKCTFVAESNPNIIFRIFFTNDLTRQILSILILSIDEPRLTRNKPIDLCIFWSIKNTEILPYLRGLPQPLI